MEKAFSRLRQQAVPVEQPNLPDVEGDPVAGDALENEAPSNHSSGKETGTKRGRRGPQNEWDGADGTGDNTASNKKRRTRRGT